MNEYMNIPQEKKMKIIFRRLWQKFYFNKIKINNIQKIILLCEHVAGGVQILSINKLYQQICKNWKISQG
jgi:hypothetical protein